MSTHMSDAELPPPPEVGGHVVLLWQEHGSDFLLEPLEQLPGAATSCMQLKLFLPLDGESTVGRRKSSGCVHLVGGHLNLCGIAPASSARP